ncbi:MAG: PilZ domain-containing protein, partial [Hyphococcus sp.]
MTTTNGHQNQRLEKRRSPRAEADFPIHVMSAGQRCAFGKLINLSREGAAIRVFPELEVDQHYIFYIPR